MFKRVGLINVETEDHTSLIASWTRDVKRKLGLLGELKVFWNAFRRWGVRGVLRTKRSERVFRSKYVGYGLIVGRKPE